jgi:hypothetical protein
MKKVKKKPKKCIKWCTFSCSPGIIATYSEKRKNMKGSIRLIVGLLITFGAAGGIETSDNLLASVILAITGLGIMYSGVQAMNKPRTIFIR